MNEIWKAIPLYEGVYEASDKGKIRTCEGKTTWTDLRGERKWKQKVLKQKNDRNGYKRVSLWKEGNCKDWLVHRLVLLAFEGENKNKKIVNHIDGNPSNNHLDNLEWCTYKENLIHAYENGLNQSNRKIVLINTKNKEEINFISMASASRFLGKNNGYVSNALISGRKVSGDYEIYYKDIGE